MSEPVDLKLFFNFRSPYCYIASKTFFPALDDFNIRLHWRPLGGWSGRSPPERAKVKVPLVRQDVRRITAKLGIPMNPPPLSTDPTRAGAVSLLAEEQGLLREWVVEVMRAEWAEGQDIGDSAVLESVAEGIGLDGAAVRAAADDPERLAALEANWHEAQEVGLIGVPSVQIGDELFWGSDRLEYIVDHLTALRARRL
jgi:2-hydroxychromene-2-carboxylate isomerase